MGGMTLDSASSTETEEQDIEDMRKIQMSKQKKVKQIRNEATVNYQNEILNYKLC